jgi:hypothetical protein
VRNQYICLAVPVNNIDLSAAAAEWQHLQLLDYTLADSPFSSKSELWTRDISEQILGCQGIGY